MVGLYSRDGVASDETMKNVIQLVRDTRKSKDDKTLADIVDWSFREEGAGGIENPLTLSCSCCVIVLEFLVVHEHEPRTRISHPTS